MQTLENAVRSCEETTARGFERTYIADWEIFILPIGNGLLGKGAQGCQQEAQREIEKRDIKLQLSKVLNGLLQLGHIVERFNPNEDAVLDGIADILHRHESDG